MRAKSVIAAQLKDSGEIELSDKTGGGEASINTSPSRSSVLNFLPPPKRMRQTSKCELAEYLDLELEQFKSSPLEYWKVNESKFPQLSKLAKKSLTPSAGSASVERLFSTAGLIQTCLRNRMSPEMLEIQLFIKKNDTLTN